MSEYIITKRTECEHPKEQGTTGVVMDRAGDIYHCKWCLDTGYVKEQVDADEWLLDRLKALRWDEYVMKDVVKIHHLTNPRFEDE